MTALLLWPGAPSPGFLSLLLDRGCQPLELGQYRASQAALVGE